MHLNVVCEMVVLCAGGGTRVHIIMMLSLNISALSYINQSVEVGVDWRISITLVLPRYINCMICQINVKFRKFWQRE